MRALAFALALLALPAAAANAPAKPQAARTWTYGDKVSTFTFGTITLAFGQGHDPDGAAVPAFQIRSPGFAPYTVVGQHGFEPVTANWAVVKLDPKNPLPEVMFSSYSGGAHCCSQVYIVEKMDTGWTAFDLGQWDGDGLVDVPTDVDGDHIIDVVMTDNRFLYTFDSYAASWAPPTIMNVIAAAVQDVSKQPRYKKFFAADMAKAKVECAKRSNGACAGYVASAARAGRFDEAWKFMLAHYDANAHWDLPARCAGKTVNGACKGKTIRPRDYPQSLHWFLEDTGYIPHAR